MYLVCVVEDSVASLVSLRCVVDDEVGLLLSDTSIEFSDVATVCDTLVGTPVDVAVNIFFDDKDNDVLNVFCSGVVVASVAVVFSLVPSLMFLTVKCDDTSVTSSFVTALIVTCDLFDVADSVACIRSVVLSVSLAFLSDVSIVVTSSLVVLSTSVDDC